MSFTLNGLYWHPQAPEGSTCRPALPPMIPETTASFRGARRCPSWLRSFDNALLLDDGCHIVDRRSNSRASINILFSEIIGDMTSELA